MCSKKIVLTESEERLIAEGNEKTLTYGEHISRYLSVEDIVKGKDVLDVASGSGYGSSLLSQKAKSVKGLDYNQEAVNYANAKYGQSNLEFSCGDAQKMPFDDNTFDVVVSFETLEHLPNQQKFIDEVRRVLKPGGEFIVSTPNDEEFIEGNEFHVHELDFNTFKQLLEKNFKKVAYYFQSTYYSVALTDAAIDKAYKVELFAHKTFPQKQDSAVYFIAIVSDQNVSNLKQNIVLPDNWSAKEEQERESIREGERDNFRNIISNQEKHIKVLENNIKTLNNSIKHIQESKSYKLVRTLQKTASITKSRKRS